MGKLKYLSRGQNKNKNLFWNKILFWNGPKYIRFFHVLPALEHHTYNEDFIFIPNHHFWMSDGTLNKV
jgi:hypothetical protein